mgnify:CR=1 FL=1
MAEDEGAGVEAGAGVAAADGAAAAGIGGAAVASGLEAVASGLEAVASGSEAAAGEWAAEASEQETLAVAGSRPLDRHARVQTCRWGRYGSCGCRGADEFYFRMPLSCT